MSHTQEVMMLYVHTGEVVPGHFRFSNNFIWLVWEHGGLEHKVRFCQQNAHMRHTWRNDDWRVME